MVFALLDHRLPSVTTSWPHSRTRAPGKPEQNATTLIGPLATDSSGQVAPGLQGCGGRSIATYQLIRSVLHQSSNTPFKNPCR
ncbi:hypothetical protein RISK_005235 [Rhodopirellula islandica]|uniref:Uncharacterized protein n=1 Tax=Rhodopirellula islandica TaxID=595434 RepID=A0A0J1EBL7_RHOIS|nr:hypothetical protein RISK_005235 [Rhodopirellula islandica]